MVAGLTNKQFSFGSNQGGGLYHSLVGDFSVSYYPVTKPKA